MTAVVDAPTQGFVTVDLRIGAAGGRMVPVTAELTATPGLVIAPRINGEPWDGGAVEFRGGFGLVHTASGARVPTTATSAPALRGIAARLAHLDWTAPDAGQYGATGSPWRVAVHAAEAEGGR